MKPETFVEKFDQFADAPGAVAKMRELVLDLAVRGKLVVQNVTDEPAAELLKRVLAEKNRRTGRSERSDEEAGSPPDDEPFEIPVNWEWIGATTPAVMVSDQGKKVQTKDILETGKYPVVDQGKTFIRGYCDDSDKVISVAEPIVLFGDHTRETKFVDFDFVVGADGVKLLQPICIDPRFYFLMLLWLPLESRGYARHFKLLRAARIPLPPLAEQRRIVAKVDELMALCDRLEAQQQERETRHAALARASLACFAEAPTPANLEFLFHNSYAIPPVDLRKSILTLAVQGKLVSQDPNDQPAEVFLASIERDKETAIRAGVTKGFKGLLKVTEADVPATLPATWKWVRAETICKTIVDCPHSTPVFVPSGVACLDTTCFKDGRLISHKIRFVSEKTYEDRIRRLTPREGDIVFAREGSVGSSVIVPQGMRCCLGQRVMLFRPMPGVLPQFFSMAISEASSLERLLALHKGIGAKHINVADMRNALLPLPPLAEQARIVVKVDELMHLVDSLESQLANARTSAAELMQAVVHELLSDPQPQRSRDTAVGSVGANDAKVKQPNRHFARALLSAEIVHQLHAEPTFGRIKHQKVFHLCESLARIPEVEGQYSRKAAGPFDNRLVYANESELKKQKWYDTVDREKAGHRYVPLEKAGAHARYVEQYWPDKLETIHNLITLMRTWDTDRCEIFSTTCAAWNDLLIWGREPTEEAILHEILDRWTPEKRRFPREKWLAAIRWMKERGYIPTGFGRATAEPE